MAATVLSEPMLIIEQDEAAALAKAIGQVSRHYDLHASSKVVDWTNLVMCLGSIYGTRFIAMRAAASREKQPDATVLNFVSGGM